MIRSKLIVSLLTLVIVLGCKKDKTLVSSEETECRDGLLPPPNINITPNLIYGEPATITVVSAFTQPFLPTNTVLELPDGTKSMDGQAYIKEFKPEDEKIYYGYSYYGSCRSKKVSFIPRGKYFAPPCSLQKNWFNLDGLLGYQNVSLSNITKSISNKKYIFEGEFNGGKKVILAINKTIIEEGEYSLMYDINFLSSGTGLKDGFVTIEIDSSQFIESYSGGKIFIAKNHSTGKFEASICNVPLMENGAAPKKHYLDLNIILD